MFRSLRAQLSFIFLGFLLLVVSSVVVTFLAIQTQRDDASVINLAGRQRMLSQKMMWLALTQPTNPELTHTINLFDQTLHALQDGGATLDSTDRLVPLPPAPDPALRAQLGDAVTAWETFRAHLLAVNAPALQTESPQILAQLDSIVSAFESRAQAKLVRLQLIQFAFLISALLLLVWGYLITRRRIVYPLMTLNLAAQRIANGQLTDPVPAMNKDELGELGQAFETMRTEIAAAREELETRVAQRTRELTSAFELSQEIVAQHNLDQLLQSVTDRARELTQSQAASLCLLDENHSALTLVAQSGNGGASAGLRQSLQRDLVRRVVMEGETVVMQTACSQCGFLLAHTPGQCVAAPLSAGSESLGALCAVREMGKLFDTDETRALTRLANSAAIAIANARLITAEQKQAAYAATLAERERLAAELHDNLAQTLSFLNLKTDRVIETVAAHDADQVGADLQHMKDAIGVAYQQVRTALVGLREPLPAMDDFAQKLTTHLSNFREATSLQVELIAADSSAFALPPLMQTQAMHIVRESLTNIRRHAQAQYVVVRVERVNDHARFTIEDDGNGFDPQAIVGDAHLGLIIMRARAERSGGTLKVESAKGVGTKVMAMFPLGSGQTSEVS